MSADAASSQAPILEVDGVHVSYGPVKVLHGVSLAVRPAEFVAIIGPNGAGKSTVLKTVMGYLRLHAGEVRFDGRPISRLPSHRIVPLGIAYVPQGRVVFPDLTVVENLRMGRLAARSADVPFKEALERVFELFPRLHERRSRRAGVMSGGEQQMLAIGRALMADPRLILLDEPSLGLAPALVDLLFEVLERLRQLDVGLLVVEQNAAKALSAADKAYVLALGRNALEGTGSELLASDEVGRLYLGAE